MTGKQSNVRRGGICAVLMSCMALTFASTSALGQTDTEKNRETAVQALKARQQILDSLRQGVTESNKAAAPKNSDAPAAKGAPKITFDKPKFEFGEVWSGDKIEHTFEVRNTGEGILKISSVKPSCGCTVAPNYSREIAPGATGKISIIINTTKLRSSIKKTVTVNSNDPTTRAYRLTVSGKIKQRVIIDPKRGGSFGRIQANQKLERTLTLKNNTDSPIELTLLRGKSGVFTGELVTKTPGKLYELTLRSDGPFTEGVNRGSFNLKTNIPQLPTINIPVNALVPPRVEVTPKEIIIPSAKSTSSKRSVSVRFNTTESYKVLSATADSKDIKVEVKEARNNRYTIAMELAANYIPPNKGHKLTIKTDDPKNAEIVVNLKRKRARAAARQRPAMKLVGKKVPSATFELADGSGTMTTTETDDQVTFAFFYASWCGYCKKALPTVEKLRKEYDGQAVRFAAISQDSFKSEGATGKRAKTKDYVRKQWKDLGLEMAQYFDPDKAGRNQFFVRSFPTMFLIGKTGTVERAYLGITAVNDGTLKSDIDTLLAGKKLPPQKIAPPKTAKKRERPAMKLAGKPAPAVEFELAKGGTFSTSSTDDKVTFAMFYASWCGFCKRALPKLSALSESYKDKPVRFVGVSLDTIVDKPDPKNRRGKTKEYVTQQWADLGVKFPQAFDVGKAGKNQFKVQSFPTMFLIGKTGIIERVYVGGGGVNDGSVKRDIDTLLAGKSIQKPKESAAATKGANRKPIKLTAKPSPGK